MKRRLNSEDYDYQHRKTLKDEHARWEIALNAVAHEMTYMGATLLLAVWESLPKPERVTWGGERQLERAQQIAHGG